MRIIGQRQIPGAVFHKVYVEKGGTIVNSEVIPGGIQFRRDEILISAKRPTILFDDSFLPGNNESGRFVGEAQPIISLYKDFLLMVANAENLLNLQHTFPTEHAY